MSANEAAAYFHSRPLSRVMALLRQRLIDLGTVGGTVTLTEPSKEELEAIRAFFGKAPRKTADGAVAISPREFEAELLRSRFACGLRESLEAYFGEPLTTRKEGRLQESEGWEAFLAELRPIAPPQLHSFLDGLRPEWRQDPAGLDEAVRAVIRAVAQLPGRQGEAERLPVFANRVTGDPHAFDPDRLAGRLLLRALEQSLPIADALSEEEANRRAVLLAAAGLGRDDLSSTVLAVGLVGEHPVLAAARREGAALAYPLRTVQGWEQVSAVGGVAYVVENPAVFGAFLDRWDAAGIAPQERPTVICTSGQLSAAAVVLLDQLAKSGAHIRYSGDFDVGGLRIARGLLRQYQGAIDLWRMDPASYCLALETGGRPWKAGEGKALEGLREEFPELVAAMLEAGRAAYQEALAPDLWGDMEPSRSDGAVGAS